MRLLTALAAIAATGLASAAPAQWTPARERALTPEYNRCIGRPDARSGVHPAMMRCGQDELVRQDDRLNRSYRRAMARLSPAGRTVLRDMQRRWIARRDGRCKLDLDGGQAAELNANGCLLQETISRTAWLDRYR